jgi:hypothetical protein
MKIWTTIGAATAALGLLAAAPAAALTLAFNVSVTSGTGAFTPYSFVQTWEVTGFQPPVDTYGIDEFHLLQAAASANPSGNYAEIQAASDLADFAGGTMVAANYDVVPGVSVQAFGLYQSRHLITNNADGSGREQFMGENIALSRLVPANGGAITEADLTAFILSMGPLPFESVGYAFSVDQYGQQSRTEAKYKGTATLLTQPVTGAVPEPASWALMIAGFGFAGASLRRRRTAAAV